MEQRMRNIEVSVIIARGLAQWISSALIETKNGTDPPTTQHVHSLDAALLHGRPHRSRRHLLVFILWSPLASLPDSDGSAPQLATAIRIN